MCHAPQCHPERSRGAAPITPSEPTLIYDDACRFCQAALHRAAATGALEGITIRGRTHLTEAEHRTLGITPERSAQEIILITPAGIEGGADAALTLLARAKRPPFLAPLARIPALRALAHPIYRAIAHNRGRLSALFVPRAPTD
jgi:predicted DCC family thiol-disulfide oxidoreductase YuxK